jgi:hypothetical protein
LRVTEDSSLVDFIALAEAGAQLRTRDRRVVTEIILDQQAGLIRGSVAREGTLTWRRDGSYADAPLNVAGPFDLVVPAAPASTQRASLQDALNESEGATSRAPFCCD